MHKLVNHAMHWLYDRKVMILADRTSRDLARAAYAAVEKSAHTAVKAAVPPASLAKCRAAMYEQRDDSTILEWLKKAVGRHSPTSLAEAKQKIAFLKDLGADEWKLDSITIARQRAYAQALASRPPSDSKRRKDDVQAHR